MKINLVLCLSVIIALAVCMMILLKMLIRLKSNYDALMESYRNLEELNSTLRAQRHDYLNHLQVVYGMMELEEYEDLHNYLEPVYKDMLKTGKALKTSKPAINALLKAKMGEAEGKGIDVYVEVKSDLKELRVADWEICKVLSNLIDNAMTALEEAIDAKRIEIDVTETKEAYVFSISNNGPRISEDVQEKMFVQGFTTKRGDGHGMGLFIVQNVLKENAGSISVTSDEKETVFVVKFKKE
ncbi:MAG: Spo0B domain-containing protein [Roseburia sp.]|nr:Spo0B domain-containing protein [Roseburia sp.]